MPDDATYRRLRDALAADGISLEVDDLDRAQKNAPNALRRWLDELGVWERPAKDKFVPDASSSRRLAMSCRCSSTASLRPTAGLPCSLRSGSAWLLHRQRGSPGRYSTSCWFGVVASLRRRTVRYKASLRTAYQLDITEARSIRAFVVKIVFGKESGALVVLASDKRYHANRDLIPREAWNLVEVARGEESWRSLARRLGHGPSHNLHVGTRGLSRDGWLASPRHWAMSCCKTWQTATCTGIGSSASSRSGNSRSTI